MDINTITSVAKNAANFENTFGNNFGYDIQRDDDGNVLYPNKIEVNNIKYSVLY